MIMKEVNEKNVLRYEVIDEPDSLQHWGVLGMKWGVRRDRKQSRKLNDKNKAKMEKDEERFKTSKKKKTSNLSDDELRTEINRRKLETELKKARNEELQTEIDRLTKEKAYADLNPPKISLGRQILEKVWPRAEKALLDAGEHLVREGLKNAGEKALGIKGESSLDVLKKEHDILDYKSKIKKLKNPETSVDDAWKSDDYKRNQELAKAYETGDSLRAKLSKTTDSNERAKIEKEIEDHDARTEIIKERNEKLKQPKKK